MTGADGGRREEPGEPGGEPRSAGFPGSSGPVRPDRSGTPWIETPAGALFFVNALLAVPVLVVAVPLVLRWIVRSAGVRQPSPFLDTIPVVADHAVPWIGWVAAVPLVSSLRALRVVRRPVPRVLLVVFAALHTAVLTYTFFRWFT